MIQRISLSILLFCLSFSWAFAAGTAQTPSTPAAAQSAHSVEQRFLQGQKCLAGADLTCAQIALSGINPASPYAKILEAQIAGTQRDYDSALRLLIPLQGQNDLLPQALAGMHTTLAAAYESQENPLRAVQHLSQAGLWLGDQEETAANQQHIWQLLSAQPKESLLEMRGESPSTLVQGWVDLALGMTSQDAPEYTIKQWRMAYPDHPAGQKLLQQLSKAEPRAAPTATVNGKVTLLLPIESPVFGKIADAIIAGFMAAQNAAEVEVYPTSGSKHDIAELYRLAIDKGAKYVVGPLTRAEVAELGTPGLVTVKTLALNVLDQDAAPSDKLVMFGLPLEAEAQQLAATARSQGMQTAIVVSAATPLARRMEQEFVKSWQEQQGEIVLQTEIIGESSLAELRSTLAEHPADMIFLAADAEQARVIRPYLDQAVPTFGLSHIYDGNPSNQENEALSAIHFIDMPWLVNPANPDFDRFRQAALEFEPGEQQRWFAVGADAWSIISAMSRGDAEDIRLNGLTGSISVQNHQIVRKLSLAQFRPDGIHME